MAYQSMKQLGGLSLHWNKKSSGNLAEKGSGPKLSNKTFAADNNQWDEFLMRDRFALSILAIRPGTALKSRAQSSGVINSFHNFRIAGIMSPILVIRIFFRTHSTTLQQPSVGLRSGDFAGHHEGKIPF